MIAPGSVKICSLREIEHARFVLDARADLFGLIFVPGVHREVTVERGRDIVQAVRAGSYGPGPLAVGVFVDSTADRINTVIREVGLDLVQLHGNEPPEFLNQLDAPAMKVLRPKPDESVDDVRRQIERFTMAPLPPFAFLVEGFHEAHHGGAGIRADWTLVAELAKTWPIMLAGGLTPDNVATAIESVRPIAVDVGSGVESNGVKDAAKIAAFVRNAKAAFGERR